MKGLLEKAFHEHKKTANYVIEKQIKISNELNDDAIRKSIERLESFIEEDYDRVVVVRGVLKGGINKQQEITDEQREDLLEIEKTIGKKLLRMKMTK